MLVRPFATPTPTSAPADSLEAELHAAIQKNAPGWQRRAFDVYYELVHGLLIKSLGPKADIGDLVGDVFVTFFENAHRIRLPDAVRSYLVSITMNTMRGEVRRQKRRRLLMSLSGNGGELEHRAGSDDPKAKAALLHLSRILDELDTDERTVFVLHGLEGMQLAEVSALLGLSLSTVKRRMQRANDRILKRVSRNALLADYIRDRTGSGHV